MANDTSDIATALDKISRRIGEYLAWLPLALVLVQFTVVVMIYVYSVGSIKLQESLQYINALMFLGGAGYTYLFDEHVRVDLFYARLGARAKAWIDVIGMIVLLIPFLIFFWWTTIPYVTDAWADMDGSVETSGLPFVYILKSILLTFALTLSIQVISALIRNIKILLGRRAAS